MLIQYDLKNVERNFSFPYPLTRGGFFTSFFPGFTSRTYNDTEICLRLEGNSEFETDEFDSGIVRTPFPHVIYKHAGMFHRFSGKGGRTGLYFVYSAETARELQDAGLLDPTLRFQSLDQKETIRRFAEDFLEIANAPDEPFFADRLDQSAFRLLSELRILTRTETPPDDVRQRIRKAASFLHFHPDREINIPALAAQFGFSLRSFYRFWHREFPLSPVNYAIEEKIRQAELLLTHSQAPIGEIAMQLRFCSVNYFSSCFRKFRGVTPNAWRKSADKKGTVQPAG